MKTIIVTIIAILMLNTIHLNASEAPLLQAEALAYAGAFRITNGKYGDSQTGWSQGKFVLSPLTNSFFINGSNGYSIAEFKIPEVINSENIDDLKYTGTPLQPFIDIRSKAPSGNPQSLNVITGMEVVGDQLIVNGADYYDAPGDNTHTTLVLNTAHDLNNSLATGFSKLEGRLRSAGWISAIPLNYQDEFGGDHIVGYSSELAIDSRNSIGPTAYALSIDDILNASADEIIPTTPLASYSLSHPITDLPGYNYSGNRDSSEWDSSAVLENDMWTIVSKAVYGFMVPDTSTYLVIGSSGGPCPYFSWDYNSYLWLFDIKDLLDVKNGIKSPYDVEPYLYGKIELPFDATGISGADYDSVNNLLYVVLRQGDKK